MRTLFKCMNDEGAWTCHDQNHGKDGKQCNVGSLNFPVTQKQRPNTCVEAHTKEAMAAKISVAQKWQITVMGAVECWIVRT